MFGYARASTAARNRNKIFLFKLRKRFPELAVTYFYALILQKQDECGSADSVSRFRVVIYCGQNMMPERLSVYSGESACIVIAARGTV